MRDLSNFIPNLQSLDNPIRSAITQVGKFGKDIGQNLLKQYIYNPESKQIFPSSPLYEWSKPIDVETSRGREELTTRGINTALMFGFNAPEPLAQGISKRLLNVQVSNRVKEAYEEFGKTKELGIIRNKVQSVWENLKFRYPQLANRVSSITIHRLDSADAALGGVSSIGKKGDIFIDPYHAETELAKTLLHEMVHSIGGTEEMARAMEKGSK